MWTLHATRWSMHSQESCKHICTLELSLHVWSCMFTFFQTVFHPSASYLNLVFPVFQFPFFFRVALNLSTSLHYHVRLECHASAQHTLIEIQLTDSPDYQSASGTHDVHQLVSLFFLTTVAADFSPVAVQRRSLVSWLVITDNVFGLHGRVFFSCCSYTSALLLTVNTVTSCSQTFFQFWHLQNKVYLWSFTTGYVFIVDASCNQE